VRFLVDESSGATVAIVLRAAGHDVLFASEDLAGASDSDLLARAEAERRILVTNDKDFGMLVFRLGRAHAGILLFRLDDESAGNRGAVAAKALESLGDRLADHFTVVSERGARSRPMRRS
jgi:predicted nuclease of predicted toxin-antitoxin system